MNNKLNADKAERIVMCWGWLNPDKTIQEITFFSADAAIVEMCNRLSIPEENEAPLNTIYQYGFKLVTLKKTISLDRILE